MYENFYHEDINSLSELEKAESLKNMLVSRATGGGADENSYNKLRKYFMSSEKTKQRLPRFVKTCRTLDEFWQFIKTEMEGNGSYAKRRMFLKEAFELLLSYLEELELSSNSTIELSSVKQAQTIDEELNLLIEEAKRRFKSSNDKKIALEKLWDAFERIKTYYMGITKNYPLRNLSKKSVPILIMNLSKMNLKN